MVALLHVNFTEKTRRDGCEIFTLSRKVIAVFEIDGR